MIFKTKVSLWYRGTHAHKPLSRNALLHFWDWENRNQRLLCRGPDAAKDCQEDLLQQLYLYNSFTRETGKEAHGMSAPRACLCRSTETSPVSSWQWCWLVILWREPRPHLVPSHCEPPASAPPSTDPLLPWKHNYIVRRVVAASFIISSPAQEGFGL